MTIVNLIAARYAPPANRPRYAPLAHPEVANPRIVDRLSAMKDLHA